MNQNNFVNTKLLIIFCLLVFGATDFAKSGASASALPEQLGGQKMPDAFEKLKSEKGLIYSGKKQSQTTGLTGTYDGVYRKISSKEPRF